MSTNLTYDRPVPLRIFETRAGALQRWGYAIPPADAVRCVAQCVDRDALDASYRLLSGRAALEKKP